MCTVTWTARPDDGYQLLFSRDEQRTRPAASPPRVTAHAGFSLLAPHDPTGGGTWIFANGHGLTACVLNFYDAPAPPAPPADGLLAISPSARALAWTWDGRQLTPRAAPTPGFITTSSFDASRVVPARHAAYAAWREEAAQDLPAFHRAASVSPDAFSVRMSRPDARTVSLTEVVCAPAERLLSMSYFPREADGPFSSGQTWQLTLREPHDSF
ncbi:MAG: NRDE family protein [Opitutaceae bacterium]|nr:NRDE family protein [Opitutaceae bacterium]